MGLFIHTGSFEEQSFMESFLEKMKISFETTDITNTVKLSKAEIELIERGLQQTDRCDLVKCKDVHEKAKKYVQNRMDFRSSVIIF
nr:hypothetical protein [uncultured Chryseobacterium sp.]